MDREARAGDLLERVELCGLQAGVNAFDLYSKDAREAFRNFCARLAQALTEVAVPLQICDTSALTSAAQAVKAACATQRDAQQNRLDHALQGLAKALGVEVPADGSLERVELLEQLVACLQAMRLLALRKRPAAPAAAAGAGSGAGQQAAASTAPAAPDTAAADGQQQPARAAPAAALETAAAGAEGSAGLDPDQLKQHAEQITATIRSMACAFQVEGASTSAAGVPLLEALVPQLQTALQQLGPAFFQPMSSQAQLAPQELAVLEEIYAALIEEYAVRRAVLIERAKVTLQSFAWSPRLAERGTQEEAGATAERAKQGLRPEVQVQLGDVWAARPCDVAALTHLATSRMTELAGGSGGASASVKRVTIGKVPDRGGRPEGRARQAHMPEFRPRSGAPAAATGGGGGRGAPGGGGGGGERQP